MTDVAIEGHMIPVAEPVIVPPTAPIPTGGLVAPAIEPPYEPVHPEPGLDPMGTHEQPDTPITISTGTTVVVETNHETTRDYALMFREHLYNGGRKAVGAVAFLKGRFSEKSTYVFLGAGIAAASAIPAPWSYASMGVSFIASMVPDHVIMDNGEH